MRREITYYAFDGKKFDTEYECREYEKSKRDLQKAYKAINTLKNFCSRYAACSSCPFYDFSDSFCKFKTKVPSQWEV